MHHNSLDCVELALLQNLVNGLTAYGLHRQKPNWNELIIDWFATQLNAVYTQNIHHHSKVWGQ